MTLAPMDTWPDLRVTVHLLPWTWRFRPHWYVDDVEGARGHCSFAWLFVRVEWNANVPLFTDVKPEVTYTLWGTYPSDRTDR